MSKSALIVIDVQNYFVNEFTKAIPEKIAQFITKNRFDFVLFTKFVNREGSNYFKLLNWEKCLGSPDTDIHPALEKFVNESNLFGKASYSIFKANGFSDFLKQNDVRKLYLCGVDIDACVLASGFDAFDLGYEVEVLTDLSLSHSGEKLDNAALEIIKKNLAKKEFAAKEKLEIVLSAPVPANQSGRQGSAGGRGVWGEFRPPSPVSSVRIFSNRHRKSLLLSKS